MSVIDKFAIRLKNGRWCPWTTYLSLNELNLVHMKSIDNQKLEFLHFSVFFFVGILPMCYIFLWCFDLICLVSISVSFWNPWKILSHFSFCHIFFAVKYPILHTFLGIFSKILLVLHLIRYCKNTTLLKCLFLQGYLSNLYSMKLSTLVCILIIYNKW